MTFTGEIPIQEFINNPMLLLILGLAAYRLTRVLLEDVVFEGLREFIWKKFPPNTKFGYLWTCYWCMGMWVSAIWFGAWLLVPVFVVVLSLVLSLSAIVGLISTLLD